MAREFHSDKLKIDQLPPIVGEDRPVGEVILADETIRQEYLEELAFMEEPVTIRIEPGTDRFAANWVSVWVNGRGAEVLVDGKWREWKHLPTAEILTTKRKYLEVIIRAKLTTIATPDKDEQAYVAVGNRILRPTTPSVSFSVLEDRNPRGTAWMTELRRRNF